LEEKKVVHMLERTNNQKQTATHSNTQKQTATNSNTPQQRPNNTQEPRWFNGFI